MRILLITHFFPPKYNAGTENYTLTLAQTFQSRGFGVEVLCAEDWDHGNSYWNGVTEEYYKGILVHRIHLNWLKAKDPNRILYDSPEIEEWLSGFLSLKRFDIVHVTSAIAIGVGVLRSIKNCGFPLVLTLMDFWFICPSIQLLHKSGSLCDGRTTPWECQSCLLGESRIFNRLEKIPLPNEMQAQIFGTLSKVRRISKLRGFRGMLLNMEERKQLMKEALSLPDIVISHSFIIKEKFSKLLPIPINVIRNGHILTWVNRFQKTTDDSTLVRFGYIGQIHKIKGVDILVKAFRQVEHNGKARLDVWGDLNKDLRYSAQLRALINEDTSIILQDRFDHEELGEVLSNIDVLIVPSQWYENAPLVIQEAFAVKIPVIATNLGGMAEAVKHGESGLLFERGDIDDLAKQITRIIEEPGLLSQLQSQIPPVKTIEEEVNELETIYRELIASSAQEMNSIQQPVEEI